MSKKDESKLIVGLDIGTSKVLAIVGEVNAEGEVEIIGYGHHPATGMRKGVVANICLLYTSPSPRDQRGSRMPSSA